VVSEGGRTKVADTADLTPGTTKLVEIAGRRLCLARSEAGEVFALDDTCSHEEESLSEGWLDGDRIECPAHNAIFDLRTGEALELPATEPVTTYPVDEDAEAIFVSLPDAD
jgi:nitrite reductase/ring-hydroxylating ferredoxin subunit